MFNKKEAIDDLKKLNGLPPYDGFSIVCGDGYYAASLVIKYKMSIEELSKQSGYSKISKKYNKDLMKLRKKYS